MIAGTVGVHLGLPPLTGPPSSWHAGVGGTERGGFRRKRPARACVSGRSRLASGHEETTRTPAGPRSPPIAAPAYAAKPEVVENVRFDGTVTELDPFLTETCGFDVFVTTKGHFTGKVYFDQDGSFKRFVGHPSMAHTFTSEFGSFETSDRGVDKFTENPDGTFTVHGTGIHFKEHGRAARDGTLDPDHRPRDGRPPRRRVPRPLRPRARRDRRLHLLAPGTGLIHAA